jgi:hypothetical protein
MYSGKLTDKSKYGVSVRVKERYKRKWNTHCTRWHGNPRGYGVVSIQEEREASKSQQRQSTETA